MAVDQGAARLPRQLSVTNTNSVDHESNQREVIGAAEAAASWIRARRAAWSDSPLDVQAPPPQEPPAPAPKRDLPVVVAFGLPAPQTPPAPDWLPAVPDDEDFTAGVDVPAPVATVPARAASARRFARARSLRVPLGRLMAVAGVAAIVAAVGVTVKAYWSTGAAKARAAVTALDSVVAGSHAVPRPAASDKPATTGRLELTSEPAGAQVVLDGKARGITPLTVDDLAPGTHALDLQSSEGSIHRSFAVKAGETAKIAEAIFGGWVKVFAPFEVTVREGAKVVRLEEGNQIMLPAGRHELHVMNRQLGYDTVHHVDLKPGETSTISVAAPASSIAVRTSAPAQVWIDGVRAGDAPIEAMSVAVGTHEVVARQPGGEERRSVVTVTVRPVTLDIDFSKP